MKKILALIGVFALLVGLSGCWPFGDKDQNQTEDNGAVDQPAPAETAPTE